jgi:hypothetical protein
MREINVFLPPHLLTGQGPHRSDWHRRHRSRAELGFPFLDLLPQVH